EPVVLKASSDGGEIEGQTAVMDTTHIRHVSVIPADAAAPAPALAALAEADQIVVGPGSLFTSVLAAVAIPGIAEGIRCAAAPTVYVANLRPQPAETEGYDVADHVAAVMSHGVPVDTVVADSTAIALGPVRRPVIDRPLASENGRAHDPARLATVLAGLVG
ncbi:MAG TPA: 2-phospho-L-lactate transferase CofD family protein, partial [Acidimicrobiales bacterium]|nr:2-phospho-L-lactate transferase CofD family protein [Acidimicrobiales bacterium]